MGAPARRVLEAIRNAKHEGRDSDADALVTPLKVALGQDLDLDQIWETIAALDDLGVGHDLEKSFKNVLWFAG